MFDYRAGAELYSGHAGMKARKKIGYQRFPQAADAIRFAIETLPPALLHGAMLEVNGRALQRQRNPAPLR